MKLCAQKSAHNVLDRSDAGGENAILKANIMSLSWRVYVLRQSFGSGFANGGAWRTFAHCTTARIYRSIDELHVSSSPFKVIDIRFSSASNFRKRHRLHWLPVRILSFEMRPQTKTELDWRNVMICWLLSSSKNSINFSFD